MVLSTVRTATLLVLVLATVVVQSAPPKKFPFTRPRAVEPEPEPVERSSVDQEQSATSETEAPEGSEETLEKIQAKSAQYAYNTSVNDTINDHTITRQEERNGLSLKGMYSYSDGFFKRTVHYVADDKGYRVVKEINIPIGNGPQVDPNGKADVSSSLTGSYSITAEDIAKPSRKGVPVESEEAQSAEAPSSEEQSAEDDAESNEEKD